MAPTKKNVLFVPNASTKYGSISSFFSSVVIPNRFPYFVWEDKVYKVNIPSCGCTGLATWAATNITYSSMK